MTPAQHGLITELEQPADPGDPAAQAYRTRIRARFAELYDQRTRTEAQLEAFQAETPQDNAAELLDQLPAAAVFASAPARIKETLLTAFDIQALYRHDQHQVTIWATLTGNTPRTIAALIADPRTDSDTGTPAPGQDTAYHSAPAPIGGAAIRNPGRHPACRISGHISPAAAGSGGRRDHRVPESPLAVVQRHPLKEP